MSGTTIAPLMKLAKKYAKAQGALDNAKRRGFHPASIDANRLTRDKARQTFETALRAALETTS